MNAVIEMNLLMFIQIFCTKNRKRYLLTYGMTVIWFDQSLKWWTLYYGKNKFQNCKALYYETGLFSHFKIRYNNANIVQHPINLWFIVIKY